MSRFASAARPFAGLCAFIQAVTHPYRFGRHAVWSCSPAARAFLFALAIVLPSQQFEVNAHVLSHLPAQETLEQHVETTERQHHGTQQVETLCLICLAFAGLESPATRNRQAVFSSAWADAYPIASSTLNPPCRPSRPRCRAPPPSPSHTSHASHPLIS